MGVKSKTIHSLSQALGTGVVFLELQLKEYQVGISIAYYGSAAGFMLRR